jgi:hypothetical protein
MVGPIRAKVGPLKPVIRKELKYNRKMEIVKKLVKIGYLMILVMLRNLNVK